MPEDVEALADALAAKLDRLTLVPLIAPEVMTILRPGAIVEQHLDYLDVSGGVQALRARYEVRPSGLVIELRVQSGIVVGRVEMGVRT